MTGYWAQQRLELAVKAAGDLAGRYPGTNILLVGAVAEGLAHARSDIDLVVVLPRVPAPALSSTILEGVRVDPDAVTQTELDPGRICWPRSP